MLSSRVRAVVAVAFWTALFGGAGRANAAILTYEYLQTGASVPGLQIGVSLTVNGTFADLPTLSCPGISAVCPTPLDFGNLLSFTFKSPGTSKPVYTLSDFTQTTLPAFYPDWDISPTRIRYIDILGSDQFDINLATGAIAYNTDGLSNPPDCHNTGACTTAGVFVVTTAPEPATLVLFGTGLGGVIVRRIRRPPLR